MSFSRIYRAMMENRMRYHEARLFRDMSRAWRCRQPYEQVQWMRAYLNALCQHLPDADLRYYISTKSLCHFIRSLQVLVEYGDVDMLCLELCHAHVRRECACNTNAVNCLAPHDGDVTNLL